MYRSYQVGLALVIAVARISGQTPQEPQRSIVTTGQGETQVTPDRAAIRVTVETRASTAAEAAAENARRSRATQDSLRTAGVAASQISTAGYSVSPEYRYERATGQRIVGYVAHNTIRVETKQLDHVGALIDAAMAGGANTIGDVEFSSSNSDEARRTALVSAVQQARADADAMARAAGGTLGALEQLSVTPMGMYRPVMLAKAQVAAADAAPTPIEPGELTMNMTVTATWTFVPH